MFLELKNTTNPNYIFQIAFRHTPTKIKEIIEISLSYINEIVLENVMRYFFKSIYMYVKQRYIFVMERKVIKVQIKILIIIQLLLEYTSNILS